VPNFSEGRDIKTAESIVAAVEAASTARIPDFSLDPDHNRMVLTLLGDPDEIRSAVFAAAARAVECIDLRKHIGEHPRIGAIDVVPLVPIRDIDVRDCVTISHVIGADLAERLNIPVFFYEHSAATRRNLPDIRRGGFERLQSLELTREWTPDLGPHAVHPSAGVTVVGARRPLVAYNVNLDTEDIEIAKSIVKKLRSGAARLEGVRSIAVRLASRHKVQVSMNVTKPNITPLKDVFSYVETEAGVLGIKNVESEIIGLVALDSLRGTSPERLNAVNFKESQILDNWL
jgi:glutamate formiminotransferase